MATKSFSSQSSLDKAIWSVCDILCRSNCAGAMQYVPELTWILFLRILDEREEIEECEARAVGADFRCSLESPYRWRDWAAPDAPKRKALQEGAQSAFYNFVNTDLIPHLKQLRDRPNATSRQKVISEIMSGVDRTRIDTERNLCDVLDKVDEIQAGRIDDTHVFALSQIYEGLLLKMGEKGNDGGSFLRRAKSSGRWWRSSRRLWERPSMIPAAALADFLHRPMNSCAPGWAITPRANRSRA